MLLILAVIAFVVFVERAQRRIPVNYAKRMQGRRMYAGQSSHLPFKLNMSGVIPPDFRQQHHPVPGNPRGPGSASSEGLRLAADDIATTAVPRPAACTC